METKPFPEMQSLTRIIEDHRRSLEQIHSFGRTPGELRRTLDQIRSLTEMPEAARRSLEEIRAVGRIPEELTRTMEQMRLASQSEALRRSLEQMRAVAAIPEELKLGLDEIRSFARIPEELRRGLEDVRALTEMPEGLRRTLHTVADNLAAQTDLRGLWDAIGRESPFAALFHSIAAIEEDEITELHIQSDGTVVLDSETVTSEEIQHAITDFISHGQQDLRGWLGSLRRPLRKTLSFLLTSILSAVIQILITPYLDQSIPLQIQQLREELHQDGARTRREVTDAIKHINQNRQDLSEWRVTIASVLNVKGRPASKARIIDRLHIGTVVHFIEKQGIWALVEYESDDDDTMKKGWVYSKYLRRLEKKF